MTCPSESQFDYPSQPVPRRLRWRFRGRECVSRSVLTSPDLVNQVAEALCREWNGEAEYDCQHDARFWQQFCQEGHIAIQAYLDALEEAGYQITRSGNAE